MKPVTQTVNTDLSRGILGNCFSASIASILEIDIEMIPNFAYAEEFAPLAFRIWLMRNGYGCRISAGIDPMLDRPYIAVGKTLGLKRRQRDRFYHAVVYQAGRMIWDPSPFKHGILKGKYFYEVFRV